MRKYLSILPLPAGLPGALWVSLIPSTAQALRRPESMKMAPLSTLCRHRHNVDHADPWVMPTSGREVLVVNESAFVRSA